MIVVPQHGMAPGRVDRTIHSCFRHRQFSIRGWEPTAVQLSRHNHAVPIGCHPPMNTGRTRRRVPTWTPESLRPQVRGKNRPPPPRGAVSSPGGRCGRRVNDLV